MPCRLARVRLSGAIWSKTELAHTVMETAAANASEAGAAGGRPVRRRASSGKDIDANKAVLDKALAQLLPLADTPQGNHAAGAG